MRLLAALLPTVQRLVPSTERGLVLGLIAFVAAIEFGGYFAVSEFHDLLAGTSLVAVALVIYSYHRTRPLAWLAALQSRGRQLAERCGQLKYELGIDFRGTPPLPQKLPRFVPLAFLGMTLWLLLGALAWYAFPDGWRSGGIRFSYTLYVLVLMALWAALLAAMAGGTLLPVYLLDQRLRAINGERTPGPPDPVVVVGYFLLVGLVAVVAPPVYPAALAAIIALIGLAAAAMPPRSRTALLWRSGVGRIHSVTLRRIVALGIAFLALDVLALLVWACGTNLVAAPNMKTAMPLTAFLGAVAAWLLPGVALALALQWWEFRRSDPTRSSPPIVHVDGLTPTADAAIRRWGFRVAQGPKRPEHVGLRLVPEADSEAAEFNPVWPLKVCESDLHGLIVRDRVARRDELQLRRQFFRALSRLVRSARAAAPASGGGYLIAPQYWFLSCILWADPDHSGETDEETLKPIGPPYRTAIPVRARQYMSRVLQATQVDAIYLEEGIGHRKVETVLRAVLELYDIHGGRRRAEDHHFHGIQKVRVIIHDYQPGQPLEQPNYPEPRFEEISRSRVLHIFKDRGDSEETLENPFDFSWEPMPLGAE